MLRYLGILLIVICADLQAVSSNNFNKAIEGDEKREGKLLSLFQIVRFTNDPCVGQGNRNGTCYTASECSAKGGLKSGNCAQGYGVCCTFVGNCGSTLSENGTYFESTGMEIGMCKLKICPCNDNICQLRLDFDQFDITGPSTNSIAESGHIGGIVGLGTGIAAKTSNKITFASKCLTDTFSVLVPTGQAPPTICGQNTGQHMYVDSSTACNDLVFQLRDTAIGTSIRQRQWNIKVTQYQCDHPNLAPDGCTQYYFGSSTDVVQTFNFVGGQHLANQNHNICIRRERGNCRICYAVAMESDFMLSGPTKEMVFAIPNDCCGYNKNGNGKKYDCLIIPGALDAEKMLSSRDQICGRTAGIAVEGNTAAAGNSKTICSDMQPFSIRFLSDGFEGLTEIEMGPMAGFKLTYSQNSDSCK